MQWTPCGKPQISTVIDCTPLQPRPVDTMRVHSPHRLTFKGLGGHVAGVGMS